MTVRLPANLLRRIERELERAYPEEGAGLLVGVQDPDGMLWVTRLLPMTNRWADDRRRRFRLDPRELMLAEDQAEKDGLSVLGVFHSHPDHPAEPSAFDLHHALPFFAYLITSVAAGSAGVTRAWLLSDDHRGFLESALEVFTDSEEQR